MELKDRIYEIVATIYHFGAGEYENDFKAKEVATNRIMELIEENRNSLATKCASCGKPLGRVCDKCQRLWES